MLLIRLSPWSETRKKNDTQNDENTKKHQEAIRRGHAKTKLKKQSG
jgi:hypothetical protein